MSSTRAEVDLGVLRANVAALAERVRPRSLLVAVKANAYGHGAVEVARALEASGDVDRLGVATMAEAIELRKAGVNLPILRLSVTLPDEVPAAIEHDVEVMIADSELDWLSGTAGLRVHLKVDTGMHRIGVRPQDAADVARKLEESPVELVGIATHLATADDPGADERTGAQLARFQEAVSAVEVAIGRQLDLVHSANSAGLMAHLGRTGPGDGRELVRAGIMAYGYRPGPETPGTVRTRPVLSWYAPLVQVKRIEAGERVGYGATWEASEPTWIGTVAVGYGDGYSRQASNRGHMLVAGHRCPIVGRVCMDQTMIDLTEVVASGLNPSPGDEAVLIGSSGQNRITADDLASWMGTISYEVTCLISHRVPRQYV